MEAETGHAPNAFFLGSWTRGHALVSYPRSEDEVAQREVRSLGFSMLTSHGAHPWPLSSSIAADDHGRRDDQATLLAEPEVGDDLAVAIDVRLLEVVEKAATLADELEQATARMVVLLVGLEVLGEIGDALGDERDLDLGRAGVGLVPTKRRHDIGLEFLRESHFGPILSVMPRLEPCATARPALGRADSKVRQYTHEGVSVNGGLPAIFL